MFESHKHILIVDVSSNHPSYQRGKLSGIRTKMVQTAADHFLGGNYDSAMDDVLSAVEAFREADEFKDHYIAEQLRAELQRLKENFPDLTDCDSVNVLVQLGVGHTFVRRAVNSEYETHTVKPQAQYVFEPFLELVNRKRHNKDVTEELVAQCIIEALVRRFGDVRENNSQAFQDKAAEIPGIHGRSLSVKDVDEQAQPRSSAFVSQTRLTSARSILLPINTKNKKYPPTSGRQFSFERVRRIELLATAWKAVVLPLYDARQSIPLLRGYAEV